MPAARRGAITGASSSISNTTNTSGLSSTSSSSSLFGSNSSNNTGGMSAFSFGSSNTPAPAGGSAFTFGTPAPAAPAPSAFGGVPAASSTPSFGASAPAPGGLSFGASTPAPSTGAFGAPNPSPAPGAFGFGSTPAPSAGGTFGMPSPAPSLFGGNPAPAPSYGAFSSGGGTFGGSTFGALAPSSAFGMPQPPAAAPAAPQQPTLAGWMHYAALPPEQAQNIDRLYNAIMQHKRSMFAVSSMAPRLLDHQRSQQADAAAGEGVPLNLAISKFDTDARQLHSKVTDLKERMTAVKDRHEKICLQSYEHALWPTELVATRLGVKLVTQPEPTSDEEKRKEADFYLNLQRLLDKTLIQTDQVEKMPSPYLWDLLNEMESRAMALRGQLQNLKGTMEATKSVSRQDMNARAIVQIQDDRIWKLANDIVLLQNNIDQLRHLYNMSERGTNVLEEERQKELAYQRSVDQEINKMNIVHLKTTASTPGPAPGGLFGSSTPAPSGGLFGSAPSTGSAFSFGTSSSPAPTVGLFGGSTTTPASGGNLFGTSTSTPAPGTPAPSSNLFGTPSAGSLFGGSTPAPASGGFGAASSTPAPAFGQTSAAAPAGGAPAFPSFGGTTTATPLYSSSSSSTPKAKNKSRSGTRARR
jgi:Nucleoporin FG repeat region